MSKTATATKINVRPLEDRVLIRPDDAENVTAGGIVLPDTAKDRPSRGTVVAVGAGKLNKDGKRIALNVKQGDSVIYGEYAGSTIRVSGDEFKIVRESDLLAKVE